jgi:glycosyltransferase involved in cell wall biosynthesis
MTEQLHVIVVNDFAHINGGAAKVALTSAIGLAEQGHRVTLVTGVAPIMPELTAAGVDVHCLGQHEIATDRNRLRAMRQGLWNRDAELTMDRVLSNLNSLAAVVHIHGWTKCLSASVMAPAIRRRFPTVVTLHDYFLACPNGGYFDYNKLRICSRKPLSMSCLACNCDKRNYAQKVWRTVRQSIQKNAAHVPTGIGHFIAVSPLSRKVMAPFLPEASSLHRVDNPIEADQQSCADVSVNDRFLWIGRLGPEKGPVLFAKAAADLGVEATFVGEGECRPEIARIAPSAEITGWTDFTAVQRYLRTSRALVFTPLWYETQGLAVLEAASTGVPAIVPDTCAARDFVEDGITGLWFKGGDLDDLKEKILKLRDPVLASSLGRLAYDKFWRRPYTLERHIGQLTDVYREMLVTDEMHVDRPLATEAFPS